MANNYMTKVEIKKKIALSQKILVAISASALVLAAASAIFLFQAPKQPNSTKGEFIFEAMMPDLSRETMTDPEGNNYFFIQSLKSSYLNETGKPKVPVQNYKIEIPDDAQNLIIEVVDSIDDQEEIDADYYPAEKPVQKTIDENIEYIDEEFNIDHDFYDNYHEFYPKNPVAIGQTGRMREVNFVEILFYPVQYRPSDQTLISNRKLTLKLTWTSEEGKKSVTLPESFKSIGKNILNHEETIPSEASLRSGCVIYPTDLASSGNAANYLIITADLFYDNQLGNDDPIELLAEHRANYSHYDVAVVRLSDIIASYGTTIPIDPDLIDTDDNLDLKIKNFIKYAYDHWDSGNRTLEYVLLVGDVAPATEAFYLPMHLSTIEDSEERIITDYWYSCLNNDQGSHYIDDIDDRGDIIIGRFSIQSATDLSTVVNKTINYELNPPPDNDWGNRSLLTSGFVNAGYTNMMAIRNGILLPNSREVNEVDVIYYSQNYQQAIDDILNNLNYGYSTFTHYGHGWEYGWQIGSAGNNIDTNDITNLNNQEKLPVVFSWSCSTGRLDAELPSLAETFVNSVEGSIAFFGSTRLSTYFINNALSYNIMQSIFEEKEYILGESILQGRLNSFNAAPLYNLLGDPALNLAQTVLPSDKPEFQGMIEGYDFSEGKVNFYTTIKNKGRAAADNVRVELFNGLPEQGGVVIDDATNFLSIPGLADVPLEISIPYQEGWEHGYSTDLYLIVDRLDEIEELNENNNISNKLDFYLNFLPNYYIGEGFSPSIHDNKLVWTENHDWNFYSVNMYDLGNDGVYGTEDDSGVIQITQDNKDGYNPSVYGNKIVWEGDTNSDQYGINLYDLGQDGLFGTLDDSGIISIDDTPEAHNPKIFNNIIIWRENDELYYGYYLHVYYLGDDGNVGTDDDRGPHRLSDVFMDEDKQFDVYGNKIVWPSGDFSGRIYMYDLGSDGIIGTNDDIQDIIISDNPLSHNNPSIYRNKILDGMSLYDLGDDGVFGTTDDLIEGFPQSGLSDTKIFGDKIFGITWAKNDIENNISSYDLFSGELEQITAGPDSKYIDQVWKNKIVYKIDSGQLPGIYLTDYYSCENSNPATCGEVFNPDCQQVDQLMCCGDNSPENYTYRQDVADPDGTGCDDIEEKQCVGGSDQLDTACCGSVGDCVYDGKCYSKCQSGQPCLSDVDGDGRKGAYCMPDGSGRWRDCDIGPSVCQSSSLCGYTGAYVNPGEANVGEYGNNPNAECCGDDAGEFLKTGYGFSRCCNSDNDVVNANGQCVPKGKPKKVQDIELPQ